MTPLRDAILSVTAKLITDQGWQAVTMSRLAGELGVSRQTVYNEVGAKPQLAEAVVLAELDRFLAVVTAAFDEHPGDVLTAINAAVRGVLEFAQDNALLHAVVSATHGANTELLPLLTTHTEGLLDAAKAVVSRSLQNYELPLEQPQLDIAVDLVVRHVLSHVMQPSGSPADTAAAVTWAAAKMLA
ncbi:TetR family transcriptional regulator [Lentzea atacamensis]|uniref:TetR family transcriptional regulator n=1 Tax=Lentzea atacamensis TaxID=531938 RepID=A0A316I403_9PSEU|nr:TetR/AcrR family transcriptional regulator [Lentzea atacamensis]PWK88201.1 TetR family transcriptional regulator [Lentzea atacamensis]RAS71070.1 TetR family transcriptional regulator [Lentzea atacamensis]